MNYANKCFKTVTQGQKEGSTAENEEEEMLLTTQRRPQREDKERHLGSIKLRRSRKAPWKHQTQGTQVLMEFHTRGVRSLVEGDQTSIFSCHHYNIKEKVNIVITQFK